MTAYVYGVKPSLNSEGKLNGHNVSYSERPECTFAREHDANVHRGMLETFDVSVGLHRCAFTVKKLDDEKYAVVCETHPGPHDAPTAP
jgi:hypothetical protein